jgi:hypothetical protein
MAIDLRANVVTDLGICVSGDLGTNHISDRSGLVMTQGSLQFDGTVTPARGTLITFLVACRQTGRVTRFPIPLRVIRAVAFPTERRSEIEVGCRLTLMKNRKDQLLYFAAENAPTWFANLTDAEKALAPAPIYAQRLLEFCCAKIGLKLAKTSRRLQFAFLRDSIDLSVGYVQIIGDLLRSECCFGRILPDETLEVVPLQLSEGGYGPILTQQNLVSIEPIVTGVEPADRYIVRYSSLERTS